MDIKNIIFNPKFYQHFLPSLVITYQCYSPVLYALCTLRTFALMYSYDCSRLKEISFLRFIDINSHYTCELLRNKAKRYLWICFQ